jgi:hypothetical protein
MYVLQLRFGMCGRLMGEVYLIDLLDGVERIDGLGRRMRLRESCRNRRGRNLIRLIQSLGRRARMIGGYDVVDGSPAHQLDVDTKVVYKKADIPCVIWYMSNPET